MWLLWIRSTSNVCVRDEYKRPSYIHPTKHNLSQLLLILFIVFLLYIYIGLIFWEMDWRPVRVQPAALLLFTRFPTWKYGAPPLKYWDPQSFASSSRVQMRARCVCCVSVCVRDRQKDVESGHLACVHWEEAEHRIKEVRFIWQEAGSCENPSFETQANQTRLHFVDRNKLI